MAKRKKSVDFSLNEILGEYFKKAKCEKTSKLFNEKTGTGNSSNSSSNSSKLKMLEDFFNHLKKKETDKENRNDDDLGFEINFGVFQAEPKVSFCYIFKRLLVKTLLSISY